MVTQNLYSKEMLRDKFFNNIYVSAWQESQNIEIVFISRPNSYSSELLSVLFLPKETNENFIWRFIDALGDFSLNPREVRRCLTTRAKSRLSKHLLLSLDKLEIIEDTVTADSAWRYEQLLDWGETSAVSVLAGHMGVQSGTMRARLAQARNLGLLESPGRGSRALKE